MSNFALAIVLDVPENFGYDATVFWIRTLADGATPRFHPGKGTVPMGILVMHRQRYLDFVATLG